MVTAVLRATSTPSSYRTPVLPVWVYVTCFHTARVMARAGVGWVVCSVDQLPEAMEVRKVLPVVNR